MHKVNVVLLRRHLPWPLVRNMTTLQEHLFSRSQIIDRMQDFEKTDALLRLFQIAMLANTWNLHTPNVIVLRHLPLSVVFVILTLPHKLNSGNPTQTQQDINHNCACDSQWTFHQGSLTRTLNAWLDSQVKGNITGQTGDWKNY